jgi:REP element-mobilizing transposase RayT
MSVTIPNLCQECHKHHHTTFVKECRLCSDLRFPEQILCNLVRDEIRDEDSFECHAFRPKLSVVSRDDTEPSQTEDESDNTEGMSPKEKWFKAYAVQQLGMNPDLIYANLRYHVVFSTVQLTKLFSHQDFDRLVEIFHQAEFPFENTNVHLLCLAPDHMHLYIDSSPDCTLDDIANAVMESSEREIAVQLPDLQKSSNSLWARACFLEGLG